MLALVAFLSHGECLQPFKASTMPLSELYRLAKGTHDSSSQEKNPTCSTDISFIPENEFVELVWENGQISVQGQSSRARKNTIGSSLPPHCLPSHSPKASRDKDSGNGNNTKMGKFGAMETVLNEIPMPVPSSEMNLNQDDDMVPWLNYPIDESIQHDYCPDFLPELSGVAVNDHSSQNNFASFEKRSSGNQSIRDSHAVSAHNGMNLYQGNVSKVSSVGGGEVSRTRTGASQLYPSSAAASSSQLCQASFPYFRSRVLDNLCDSSSNAAHNSVSGDSVQVFNSSGSFPSIKIQKHEPLLPGTNSSVVNFSHFSRPAALVKANLQNISARVSSHVASIERMGHKDKGSAAASSSNPVESTLINPAGGLQKETCSHCQPIIVPSKVDVKPVEAKPAEETLPAEVPDAICLEDTSKTDRPPGHFVGESSTKGLPDGERTIEPVVASSSVCSGNSVERASETHDLKRKCRDTEESDGPSEDVEKESAGVKKAVPARGGTGSKRSRAAEVHNLSERRRRDRINEKMRALQELIPNCNKVDKASMLDEAIEYLKALQLQVQIMSMGAGLYMPPMMLPTGIQPMHAAHMTHFSPLAVGMGMGMGFGMCMPDINSGSSGCPMVQVPPMHGAHFPGPSMAGPAALHGMAGSSLQMFGLPGQGLPISMPRAPLIPLSGGTPMKTAVGMNACGGVGPMDNLASVPASSSKDSMQNINSQGMRHADANSSMHQTSSQCQATNECFEQSALVQNNYQTTEVAGSRAFESSNGSDNTPGRATVSD